MIVSILAKERLKRKEKVIRENRIPTTKTGQGMKVTVVTTMRNEAPHLLEWVAHHRAAGITDFLIYTNDCQDGTEALLELLPNVTHVPLEGGKKPPQWRALRAASRHPIVDSSDWICCIDCDEFINFNSGLHAISDVIHQVDADAIILPWRLFGNSGLIEAGEGLTIERFTRASPEDMLYPAIGSYFKTLFRGKGPFRQLGVHRPKQRNPHRHKLPKWVDGSGQAISGQLAENDGRIMNWGMPIARDLIQLNHYSVRSVEEFMIKRIRGLPNHQEKPIDLTYWVERNFNDVEDTTISHMVDETKDQLANLMNLPGVETALTVSKLWHKDRFEALMKDPGELNLFGRIILAGSSVSPSEERARKLVEAYQIANR